MSIFLLNKNLIILFLSLLFLDLFFVQVLGKQQEGILNSLGVKTPEKINIFIKIFIFRDCRLTDNKINLI
jgi:hypothetical protein